MDVRDARELIRGAIDAPGGSWADLGAGSGTFTRALASLIGPEGSIVALDADERALRQLVAAVAAAGGATAEIEVRVGDFTRKLAQQLEGHSLRGALFANALHFAAEPSDVLEQIGSLLEPGGRLVVVEYENRAANPWVPYPLPFARLAEVLPPRFEAPRRIATRPSIYGGAIYCAVADLSD